MQSSEVTTHQRLLCCTKHYASYPKCNGREWLVHVEHSSDVFGAQTRVSSTLAEVPMVPMVSDIGGYIYMIFVTLGEALLNR
jgi:hypothetical protein